MTVSISGTGGVTFPDNSVQATAATGFGFKNRIINGAMVIDQRNAGASVTATNLSPYTVDRWAVYSSPTSKFTAQRNAGAITPPAGFTNYLGCTSSSAYSVGATDRALLFQFVEGFNAADLSWGTANAAAVTLSFRVYSSLTGTFGGALQNQAATRSYPFSFSVPVANTWTTVSVSIAGDTSGTWGVTNDVGISVYFGLGVGSTYSGTAGAWAGANYSSVTGATSVVGTSGATFYITGVQLEKGSTATAFDVRPYGTELALCQRYYYNSGTGSGLQFGAQAGVSGVAAEYMYVHPVFMRASPALSYASVGNFSAYLYNSNVSKTLTSASISAATIKKAIVAVGWSGASGAAGYVCSSDAINSDFFAFSAEL